MNHTLKLTIKFRDRDADKILKNIFDNLDALKRLDLIQAEGKHTYENEVKL